MQKNFGDVQGATLPRLTQCVAMPGEIRDIKGEKTEYFKRELDRWLKGVPDEPEIDEYRARTNSNSIVHQASQAEKRRWKKY